MLKIMVCAPVFAPGFSAGGSVRTVVNLIQNLQSDFRFTVITKDRVVGATEPYDSIATNQWQDYEGSEVNYLSPDARGFSSILGLLRQRPYDLLFLNSVFAPATTIKPLILRRLGLLQKSPVIVAPRGELFPAALDIKGFKKKPFLYLARLLGLFRGVTFQATDEAETDRIRMFFGRNAKIIISPDIPSPLTSSAENIERAPKARDHARIIFLGRIAEIKNLPLSIDIVGKLQGEIEFDIYGPIEDESHWEICQQRLKCLPDNVTATYHGPIAPQDVEAAMANHDAMLLPTGGENFGYVILEAMVAGCPPVISDQTPWRDLTISGTGWDLPLETPDAFVSALQAIVNMGENEHCALRAATRAKGIKESDPTSSAQHAKNLIMSTLKAG